MRAALHVRYGSFVLGDSETPRPGADELLVRVRACSLNAVDWYGFKGRPYFARPMMGMRRPRSRAAGTDFAGVVAAVGDGATGFGPGDEVYGCKDGAFAEYVLVANAVARKPAGLSFEEAAAVPVAGVTALQGLRDHGGVRPGHKVLVNGAAGGVGTFAVQIAAALGAEVHAVCSTCNLAQASKLGATRVFDYTCDDFARSGERYDILFDNAGNRSWRSMRAVLARSGTVVLVGGPREKRWLGPLGHIGRAKLAAMLDRGRAVFFIAKPNADDLGALRELIESGQVKPVIAGRYDFEHIGEAMRQLDDGHARAKTVVTI